MALLIILPQYLLYFLKSIFISLVVFLFTIFILSIEVITSDNVDLLVGLTFFLYITFLIVFPVFMLVRTKYLKNSLVKTATLINEHAVFIHHQLMQKYFDKLVLKDKLSSMNLSLKSIRKTCDAPFALWLKNHKEVAELSNLIQQFLTLSEAYLAHTENEYHNQLIQIFQQDIEPKLQQLVANFSLQKNQSSREDETASLEDC